MSKTVNKYEKYYSDSDSEINSNEKNIQQAGIRTCIPYAALRVRQLGPQMAQLNHYTICSDCRQASYIGHILFGHPVRPEPKIWPKMFGQNQA